MLADLGADISESTALDLPRLEQRAHRHEA